MALRRSPQDNALITALAHGATIKAAAEAAGVSEQVAKKRVNSIDVMDAVRAERSRIATQLGSRLMAMSLVAAEYLMSVVRDPTQATQNRVRAASVVIAESRAWQDAELAERLDELEAELGLRSLRTSAG